jgi:SAM-dependent methyltransferase
MPICNICGHDRFVPGPFGRLSRAGLAPRCARCRSLERHRAARQALDRIREPDLLRELNLIRFSDDPILDDSWFRTSEVSTFEGANSLDIQAIDRTDEAYDVVLCCHVIEHVPDDRKAIRELTRILSRQGFLLLVYPRAEEGDITEDWGFADPEKNGHYRGYGRDFEGVLADSLPGIAAIAVEATDPVTGDGKKFAIISKSLVWTRRVLEHVPGARLLSERA